MHAYLLTRGIKNEVDALIRDLQAQYYTYKREDGVYDPTNQHVQFSVRPIQLWELVFPKAHLQDVLKMIRPSSKFSAPQSNLDKYAWAVRKALGAEPVPEWDVKGDRRLINYGLNVQKLMIGIKEDILYGKEAAPHIQGKEML